MTKQTYLYQVGSKVLHIAKKHDDPKYLNLVPVCEHSFDYGVYSTSRKPEEKRMCERCVRILENV